MMKEVLKVVEEFDYQDYMRDYESQTEFIKKMTKAVEQQNNNIDKLVSNDG